MLGVGVLCHPVALTHPPQPHAVHRHSCMDRHGRTALLLMAPHARCQEFCAAWPIPVALTHAPQRGRPRSRSGRPLRGALRAAGRGGGARGGEGGGGQEGAEGAGGRCGGGAGAGAHARGCRTHSYKGEGGTGYGGCGERPACHVDAQRSKASKGGGLGAWGWCRAHCARGVMQRAKLTESRQTRKHRPP